MHCREVSTSSTGFIQVFNRYKYVRVLASSRKNNEDRVEVIERGDDLVVVVADGAGGMRVELP